MTVIIIPAYNKITVINSDYEVEDKVLYPELDIKDQEPVVLAKQTKVDGDEVYLKDYYSIPDVWNLYQYKQSGTSFSRIGLSEIPDDLQNRAGCTLISRTNYDLNDIPNKLDYEYLFQIKLFDNQNHNLLLDSFNDVMFPVIKTAYPSPVIAFDNDIRLCISFSIQYSDRPDGFVLKKNPNKDDQVDKGDIEGWYVPIQIRIGDHYYDGKNWSLNTSAYINVKTDLKRKQQHFSFDWLNARNTNSFLYGTSELDGTLIEQKFSKIGDLEIIIYCPKAMQDRYLHRYVFLKDIKISSQRINHTKNISKQDTLYSNVISEQYVNELEDIELKLSSKNKSELSFSKLSYDTGTGEILLDSITNFMTNNAEKPEQLLIQRVVNQYAKPKLKLVEDVKPSYNIYQIITDNSISGKDFIISSESINYADNTSSVTLIEIN